MAYTLVCSIVPIILLVIAVCMLVSDFYFIRREKKNGITPSFTSVWFIARLLKTITIVSVAYLLYTLDPQFLQPRPDNAPPAEQEALNAYNRQWNIAFVLSLVFIIAFVTDVFGRLKLLQTSEQKRAEQFFKLHSDTQNNNNYQGETSQHDR